MRRLLFFLMATTSLYPLGCNKHCGECVVIMPLIKASAVRLHEDYLSTEKEISNYYEEKIIPLLEQRNDLEAMLEKLNLKIEILDQKTTTTIEAIKRQKILKNKEIN